MVTWFFQDTELCVFKQRKKNVKLISCGVVFTLTFLSNRAHLNFDPLGLTYIPPRCRCDGFSVFTKQWNVWVTNEWEKRMFFSLIQCWVHPSIDCLSDWQTGRLSVICICVVLLYSKRNWMICPCVFYNKVSFFIWVQWDHVETMYDSRTAGIEK